MGGVTYGTGRSALLEAAINIVATQGLRGMTYRNVAAAAGVTQGLVKHHFGNWDALLEEALLLAVEQSIEWSDLESDEPGFEGFARKLGDLVTRSAELEAFQFELALEARRRPDLLPILHRVYETYREAVGRELARNGVDDPDLTWAVFAALDGLAFQQTVFGARQATDGALESLRRLLRVYVAKNEANDVE